MPQFIDITGQRFGRLVVKQRDDDYVSPKGYHATNWICECDCGNTVVVRKCNLTSGASTSCGCKRVDEPNRTTHGQKHTRLYGIWLGMKDRCSNPSTQCYKDYGGRGIYVCEEWEQSFVEFYTWSYEHGYSDGLTIDRIDNDGPYAPDNCRWADTFQQANNRRTNRLITYNGETKTIAEWSRETGIKYNKLYERINKCGWDIERALTTP